jgi:hypothetical protein
MRRALPYETNIDAFMADIQRQGRWMIAAAIGAAISAALQAILHS